MAEQLRLLPGYLTAHLQLSLLALAIGIALSVPLGIWIAQRGRFERSALGLASVVQTIPSLALLAIMVPTLAALAGVLARVGVEIRSIGFAPALAALSLYSVLPILRNTVTGIRGVDPALVEAARGVGMTDAQRLRRVELPLAMPVVVAGIRTAAVWVVGTATLSTPVGATSLGNFIFSGLQTRNYTAVLVGCIAAALLAIGLDQLIHALEAAVRRRRRARVVGCGAALLALAAWAFLGFAWDRGHGGARPVAIGAKTFTEQYVLSEILAQHLARRAGAATRSVPSLGSTVAFDALVGGDLDVYVDYSGTIWATIMGRGEPAAGRQAVLREVGRYLRGRHGVEVAAALGFENTYALGMRADHAAALGVSGIGGLARHAPELEIGGDYEFFQRPEWAALRARYGLHFRARRSMDSSLMYQALAAGDVDVISAFSTDGRIAAFDIALLEDERGVIPPYDAIVLVSGRLARERPALLAALRELDGRIDADAMRRMNLAVDRDGEAPAEVAGAFLDGLDRSSPGR